MPNPIIQHDHPLVLQEDSVPNHDGVDRVVYKRRAARRGQQIRHGEEVAVRQLIGSWRGFPTRLRRIRQPEFE